MDSPIRIAITTGDTDGIGFEVATKALAAMGPQPGVEFYLWRDRNSEEFPQEFETRFSRRCYSSLNKALERSAEEQQTNNSIFDLKSSLSPVNWIEESTECALKAEIDALVTAPISKTLIAKSGRKEIGHTELIQSMHGKEKSNLFMVFLGEHFNVLLATGHIPLDEVCKSLNEKLMVDAIVAAAQSVPSEKPIAVLGLNPHAGEQGLIGPEEKCVIRPAIETARAMGISVEGPFVPDAAFSKENWDKFSIFVCPYHDQGLIPFKMIHGHDGGVHLTYGIDFVRTSVDHGTAKEIYNKNMANPSSMIHAIEKAIELAKDKKVN